VLDGGAAPAGAAVSGLGWLLCLTVGCKYPPQNRSVVGFFLKLASRCVRCDAPYLLGR
jgi:hypothetical protein